MYPYQVGLLSKRFQSTPPVKAATPKPFPPPANRKFQSTPPVKAATKLSYLAIRGEGISIHAAREGGDVGGLLLNLILLDFNPRRP